MYKRKHKLTPYNLSLSSKASKTDRGAKPATVCEVVVEINNENDSGTGNVSFDLHDNFRPFHVLHPPRMLSRRLTVTS